MVGRILGRFLEQVLIKVIGRACLSYEELSPVLYDCKNVIFNRPITFISDYEEYLTLTPAMFSRGIKESRIADCDKVDGSFLCKRSKYRKGLSEELKKRFRSEYLGQL